MVEEALQHEVDTLRKLVLELTTRTDARSATDSVTREELVSEIRDHKEYNATVRGLNSQLLDTKARGQYENLLIRINSVEQSQKTFEDNLTRIPTQLDREAKRLTELFDEKMKQANLRMDGFNGIEKALREAAKEAIASAFAAAKELTGVYNTGMTSEVSGLKAQFRSDGTVLDTKISNLADRLNLSEKMMTRGEGMFAGGRGVVGAIASGIGLVILVAGFYISTHNSANPDGGKRVDDLIAGITEQNRQVGQRMDALSARLNALTPVAK